MDLRSLITVRSASIAVGSLLMLVLGLAFRSTNGSDLITVTVARGPLLVTLSETGTLRPAEALTYRSRVPGREIEITWLAPEGAQVREGDLIVRLDTTELGGDLERAAQALRQAQLDAQVAEAERQAANAALDSLSSGRGALDAEEARFNLKIAEQKAERMRQDYESLAPLLAKGFVTREELERAALELEQAQATVEIAKRRATVITEQSVPQERQRAGLDVAHRAAQIEVARQRLAEASSRVSQLRQAIETCTIRAQHAGMVVYEENMASSPRRKVRGGDRVTPSQGLVTIPEVKRMLVDTSLREADLYRVSAGQPAAITLEAYPGLKLTGRVLTVGTVARVPPDRPFEGKRFDVVVDIDPNRADLRPEMTASVQIEIARRADALLVPVNAIFDQDGHRVVHVVGARGTETRRVALGESNDVYVEVLQGVKEGERLQLSDGALDGSSPRPASARELGPPATAARAADAPRPQA
jgi:HlyD family secretion protein